MEDRTFIGIDPGLSGGIVFCEGGRLSIYDMPTLELTRNKKNKRELDLYELAAILRTAPGGAVAIIEQVGAMPGQGVSSTFAFGKVYGAALMGCIALQIPVRLVAPVTWKKWARIPTGSGKDASRAKAKELFPASAGMFSRVKDNGRADAALLAAYGQSTHNPGLYVSAA